MGAVILDAGVVIALLDRGDRLHRRAVDEVEAHDRAGRTLVVPASAYAESLVAFARVGRIADARDAIAGMGITVRELDGDVAEDAARLRAEHGDVRLPDALVLATARVDGAALVTYDERLRHVADG